ncbi:MAG: glucose-1-phosphate adenylyltransferase subunit GlgD [Bacilli bacterium]|jgi:glucose-1-phosphate adenylyltransferase
MSVKVLGLVNCFDNPDFGPMTRHRAIASTSFLGRYAFIDVPLSNFLNSGIPSIGILCQNHIRSLSRHVGNGRSWINNTKIGDFQVLYDEPNVANPGYNTDVADINENRWFMRQVKPDYVVIAPPYMVYEADFKALIQEHIASGARITMLYMHGTNLKKSFINQSKIWLTDRGKITKMEPNRGEMDEGDISLGTYIMDYPMLESLLDYAKGTSSFFGLSDTLNYLSSSVLIKAVKLNDYVRCFDSLSHYLKFSLELLDENTFHELFADKWPIYTKTYDTPPVLYKSGCHVENSYIANGSIIEGTVINSVLGRGVVVKKGAIIKNAVIGSDAIIDENTHIENAVVDKEAQVLHISEVVGTLDDPLYISRGDIV